MRSDANGVVNFLCVSGTLLASFGASTFAVAQVPSHVAPAIRALGTKLGKETPEEPLTLTVWLNLRHRDELDARVKALYTPDSPTYRHWLSPADLQEYAPTPVDVQRVLAELKAHNLSVQSVDPFHYFVRFTGKSSDVESAFGTKIDRYLVKGRIVHTTSAMPQLTGAAAGLVQHVGGLNSLPMVPHIQFPTHSAAGTHTNGIPLSSFNAGNTGLSNRCFYSPAAVTVSGLSASDQTTPLTGTFTGLVYGAGQSSGSSNLPIQCGYSPTDVRQIYGLDTAYHLGYSGTGQTIVLLEAFLEPTAKADLAQFSKLYNLPPITDSNFAVYNPYNATVAGVFGSWYRETALDIEWAHAVAPDARIALLEATTDSQQDLAAALSFAVNNRLGNVISASFGQTELNSGASTLDNWNSILELAAAEGIAVNVSTGDHGDFSQSLESLGVPDVSTPADSPYATAVGGTSVALFPNGSTIQTGWGNNLGILSEVSSSGSVTVQNSPAASFIGGAGGGSSSHFNKPSYQSSLPGNARLLPDVSALADPFTGAALVYTDPSTNRQMLTVAGGTSLAAPVFSGIWTLVNQFAGVPLGQAAPFVAATTGFFIHDVVPVTGLANVTASIKSPGGTSTYAAGTIANPGQNASFVSALVAAEGAGYDVLTFGTDSSLTVTPGWDNVTGFGTPNLGQALEAIGATSRR